MGPTGARGLPLPNASPRGRIGRSDKRAPDVNKLLAFIAQAVAPMAVTIGGIWSVFSATNDWDKRMSMTIFLGGLVYAIVSINENHKKLAEVVMADRRYRAFGLIRDKTVRDAVPHVSAGLFTADANIEYAYSIAEAVLSLEEAKETSATITETYVLNEFLQHLAHGIPKNSTWVGTTALTDGWRDNEDIAFVAFKAAIQKRALDGHIKVLRIYLAERQEQLDHIRGHLEEEVAAGIVVRTLVTKEKVPDLTLLWRPNSVDRTDLASSTTPTKLLDGRTRDGLFCALEFRTSLGRLVNSVNIIPTRAQVTRGLRDVFDKSWGQAKEFRHPPA